MDTQMEKVLIHYGKKGMHWGQRSGTSASSIPKVSQEHAQLKITTKNRAHKLSDSELKSAISRMNLEKQYKDLNPKGLSKANKIAISILAIGTTVNAAISFSNSPAGKAVVSGVKSLFSKTP